jgi:hypothetical protein
MELKVALPYPLNAGARLRSRQGRGDVVKRALRAFFTSGPLSCGIEAPVPKRIPGRAALLLIQRKQWTCSLSGSAAGSGGWVNCWKAVCASEGFCIQ